MTSLAKASARENWKRLRKEIAEWPSTQVCARILAHPAFQSARQVGVYSARPGEIDLTDLWQARPEACVFPRVAAKDRLAFRKVGSLSALKPGFAGIAEPDEDEEPAAEWTSSDLVLVPGSAFDMTGARVGSGAGFYDRFLSINPAIPWGVCWDRQIVADRLVQEPTDVKMKALCTESGIRLIDG